MASTENKVAGIIAGFVLAAMVGTGSLARLVARPVLANEPINQLMLKSDSPIKRPVCPAGTTLNTQHVELGMGKKVLYRFPDSGLICK